MFGVVSRLFVFAESWFASYSGAWFSVRQNRMLRSDGYARGTRVCHSADT